MHKTIICLANSRKMSGRCVAGKEVANPIPTEWIRPVSARDNHEISEQDRRYSNGTTAQVGDIIQIVLKQHLPHTSQAENFLIDDSYYWTKIGTYSDDYNKLLDTPDTLWQNGYSSGKGFNDQVPVSLVITPVQSLYFIKVNDLQILVVDNGFGKKQVRGKFSYKSTLYNLVVTDPNIEAKYLSLGVGCYDIPNALITISLGEPLNENFYKLIAYIREGV